MQNFFYFDTKKKKYGPITETQLKELVTWGVIKPETPLETSDGHKGKAGHMPGLFATSSTNPFQSPSPFTPQQDSVVPEKKKPNNPNDSIQSIYGCGCILCIVLLPVCFVFPPAILVLVILLPILIFIGAHLHNKKIQKQNNEPKRKKQISQAQKIDNAFREIELKLAEQFVEARMKLARPIRVNDLHAGNFIERQEMIEIITARGRRKIFMIGKEGDSCHCYRLNSNPDIINADGDLIDTQGSKCNKHCFFEQMSFDKKTNQTIKKTKTLTSWRLFERQWKLDPKWHNTTGEFEDVYYDDAGVAMVHTESGGWTIKEDGAKKAETLVSDSFFYFDHYELKRGPFTKQQFQDLVDKGIIKPNTPVKTEDGQEGIAKQVPGLVFAQPPKPIR